jgi:hypothetical protein
MSVQMLKRLWTLFRILGAVSLCLLSLMIPICPSAGWMPTTLERPREIMAKPVPNLVGSWQKITHSECSQFYPDRIQFQENGLYVVQKESPAIFSQWDVGRYERVDAEHIKLSTANDAVISYHLSTSDQGLKFTDPEGCEFEYRKISE